MSPPHPRSVARVLRRTALLLALGAGGSADAVWAQAAPADPSGAAQRVTFVAVGVPLQEALEALIDQTRIALVYENARVAGRTAYCRAERVRVEEALACVLRGTGLDYARLSSGTYTLFFAPEAAPRYGRLSGEVVDAETGAPLLGAHVVLARAGVGEPGGTATNAAGRFALPGLLPGPRRLIVTHVGYRRAEVTVHVAPDALGRVAVTLSPEPVLAAPVVVSGLARRALSERLGEGRLDASGLAVLPSDALDATSPEAALAPIPATPDVTRALDAVVGVRAGDALSDVHVQGGAVGEHAFRLDGAPVFVPVSLGGLVGPLSPFALARVVVRKAGFDASQGSHLAGVIEAESAVASSSGQALAVQADLLSLNARWGGRAGDPARREGTWAVAVRQGLWNAYQPQPLADRLRSWSVPDTFLVAQLGQAPVPDAPDGFPVTLGFTDAHVAGRLRLGGLRSLHGSLYLARHDFSIEDVGPDNTPDEELYEDAYRWSNLTGQLRYEWVAGDRAFAHVGAWTSGYGLRRPSVLGEAETDYSEIVATGARAGLDLAASPRHAVAATFEATHYDTAADLPATLGAGTTGSAADAPLQWSVAGSVEDRVALGSRATLTLGSRLTWLPERQALFAEPRAALRYDGAASLLGPWALRLAAGRYLQFLNAVDVADGGPAPLLPRVRFWLPLPNDARAPEAYHLATEALVQPAEAWEIGAEAYVKHQPHLLVPNYGGTDSDTGSTFLTAADGYAYGLALRADWRTDRLRLGAAYEYAVARQRTPDRFAGAWVPTPWDAPHRVRLALDAVPLRHVTVTLRGETVIGRTWGFRQAYYDLLEPSGDTQVFTPFDLSTPGAHRLPAFAQLDFSAAYGVTVRGVGVQARAGILNVLGRDNVRDRLLAETTGGTYTQRPRYAMPFFPFVALRLSR